MEAIKTGQVLGELLTERKHQDEKWRGPEHDDQHDLRTWFGLINERLYMPTDFMLVDPAAARRFFIEIGALAVAAIESIDRRPE